MTNNAKLSAENFIKKHSLKKIDYKSLSCALEKLGYTVVEFNKISNDADVEVLVENLDLAQAVTTSKGFTYADKNYRIVFVNNDLSEDEKTIVLSHELGHIVCGHFSSASIIGRDVNEEHEANEFSHYLLKERSFFSKHKKKILIFSIIAVVVASIAFFVTQAVINTVHYSDYYITDTGTKYHKKDCKHIKDKTSVIKLSKEDFENNIYEACNSCLPDK